MHRYHFLKYQYFLVLAISYPFTVDFIYFFGEVAIFQAQRSDTNKK